MPKILLNFKVSKKTGQITLKYDEPVFADLPICVADYDVEYTTPVVVNIPNQIPVVMEKEHYDALVNKATLKEHEKLFVFKLNDDGTLVEDPEGDIKRVLPKDTDISKLKFVNGEVVWLDEKEGE
jgi:hypothetical protein